MQTELVQQEVGGDQVADRFGHQKGRQPFLPKQMSALDLALGLWRRGIAQGDLVEPQRLGQVDQLLRPLAEKEAVLVHIQSHRQPYGFEGAAEEIQMSQERFPRIQTGSRDDPTTVVNRLKQMGGRHILSHPGMRGNVILPKLADGLGLPSSDGLRVIFPRRVRRGPVSQGPAANSRSINVNAQPPLGFRSDQAVGARGTTAQELVEECFKFGRGIRLVISARKAEAPRILPTLGDGAQVALPKAIELVAADLQFDGGRRGRQLAGANAGEQISDKRGTDTMGKLQFWLFISSILSQPPPMTKRLRARSVSMPKQTSCSRILVLLAHECHLLLAPRHPRARGPSGLTRLRRAVIVYA